jgi:cyclase
MTFRSVIVCRIVPGSEGKVADVFGHYDKTTRPQDFGVIGRTLLSLDDLYIHVIERNVDPKTLERPRGLPAFQQIAEAIATYVTPYPKNWKAPSDSVAKEFYSWVPATEPESATANQTVIVQRMKPGAESDIARIFEESDAGPLPAEMGVTGRWLYSLDDVFLHLLERTDESSGDDPRQHRDRPDFAKILDDLSPFINAYSPDTRRSPEDPVRPGQLPGRPAKEFYRWRADI